MDWTLELIVIPVTDVGRRTSAANWTFSQSLADVDLADWGGALVR